MDGLVKLISMIAVAILLASCNKYSYQLVYNSNQIGQPITDSLKIKYVYPAFWSDSLVVRLTNKEKRVLPNDSIWGIKYGEDYYRYFKKRFYRLNQLASLVVYSIHHSTGKSSHTDYYFSKNENSEIFRLTRKKLRTQFASDSCVLEAIKFGFKWYQSYSKFDKQTNSYRIVDLYKKCNRNKG
jgi:hypothetical protein